jgi:hypothetical protein
VHAHGANTLQYEQLRELANVMTQDEEIRKQKELALRTSDSTFNNSSSNTNTNNSNLMAMANTSTIDRRSSDIMGSSNANSAPNSSTTNTWGSWAINILSEKLATAALPGGAIGAVNTTTNISVNSYSTSVSPTAMPHSQRQQQHQSSVVGRNALVSNNNNTTVGTISGSGIASDDEYSDAREHAADGWDDFDLNINMNTAANTTNTANNTGHDYDDDYDDSEAYTNTNISNSSTYSSTLPKPVYGSSTKLQLGSSAHRHNSSSSSSSGGLLIPSISGDTTTALSSGSSRLAERRASRDALQSSSHSSNSGIETAKSKKKLGGMKLSGASASASVSKSKLGDGWDDF